MSPELLNVAACRECSFDVDLSTLESTFKDSQMKLHPDRFASKTPIEQGFSAEQSTKLNIAYRTLRKPLTRAKYLVRSLVTLECI